MCGVGRLVDGRSPGAAAGLWELAQWPKANGHVLDAVVGPACSGASLGAVYYADALNIPMISYSATSGALSGRSEYFFRLAPTDSAKVGRLKCELLARSERTPLGVLELADAALERGEHTRILEAK